MALFSRRDRIAITVIAAVIIAGWGVRYTLYRGERSDVQVIRHAVSVPDALTSVPDSTVMPVDINTADEQGLRALPMIGPVRAADIVAYRREYGPFTQVSDIMNVEGIGPVIFETITAHITVTQTEKPPGEGERTSPGKGD